MAQRVRDSTEMLANLMILAGIIVAAIFIIAVFKLKGGLLGLVLGTMAVIAMIYWVREIKRVFNEKSETGFADMEERDWFYDLIEEEENIIFVARVPGPPKEIKVKVADGILEIRGGGGFAKKVQIPENVKLLEKSYLNGVLRLKLKHLKIEPKKTAINE